MKKEKLVTLRVTLPNALVRKVDLLCKKLGISRADFIVRSIKKYLLKDAKRFEYLPDWVKLGLKVKVKQPTGWVYGTVTSTPNENDRGVEITTDRELPRGQGRILSLPVYMTITNDEYWNKNLQPQAKIIPMGKRK